MVTTSSTTLPVEAGHPAWRRIANDLAGAIRAGQHKPGDPLPTALSLAESYGVHRHTARQALLHLQQQGLVSVERGRGTFVTQPHLPYRLGRRVRFSSNAAAAGVAVEGQILETAVVPAEDAVALALGLAVGEEVWRIETLSRAGGVTISSGMHFLSHSRFPDFDADLRRGLASITRALAFSGIADYVRVSTALSARGATAQEAELLGLKPGAAVMIGRAVDGLPDGEPIHLVVTVFAGERVEFLIDGGQAD